MNPLALATTSSSLDEQEKITLQAHFENYFEQVEEWKDRAMKIVVKSPDDTEEIARAKEVKKFMQNVRLNTEDKRKELKAPSLEYGRTIDAIAKVITEAVVPIEKYLEAEYKKFDPPKIEKVISDKDKILLFIRAIEAIKVPEIEDEMLKDLISTAKNNFIKTIISI